MTTRIVQETVASLFQHASSSMTFDIPNGANTGPAITPTFSFNSHVPIPSSTATLPPSEPALLPRAPFLTRSIILAGGVHIVFTESDVPRPPSVSFARDVQKDFPALNGMWDDRTEHWAGASFLNIQGHPIPMSPLPHLPELLSLAAVADPPPCWVKENLRCVLLYYSPPRGCSLLFSLSLAPKLAAELPARVVASGLQALEAARRG
jgi:hypothetical protein